MWEYDRVVIKVHKYSEIKTKLDELGNDNWEVIYYHEEKQEKFESEFKVTVLAKRNIYEIPMSRK
jgi:hypothetical protein